MRGSFGVVWPCGLSITSAISNRSGQRTGRPHIPHSFTATPRQRQLAHAAGFFVHAAKFLAPPWRRRQESYGYGVPKKHLGPAPAWPEASTDSQRTTTRRGAACRTCRMQSLPSEGHPDSHLTICKIRVCACVNLSRLPATGVSDPVQSAPSPLPVHAASPQLRPACPSAVGEAPSTPRSVQAVHLHRCGVICPCRDFEWPR